MFNCHDDMSQFHNEYVRLTIAQRDQLDAHRTANRTRLKDGLAKLKRPAVHHFVPQGSREMKTINQHPDRDYDLDDGAAFLQSDLVKSDGTAMTPLEAREMVRDAIQDSKFKRAPEVRENCVRVYYEEGYHIDIPVYRIPDPKQPDSIELASGDSWRKADPIGVTEWFKDANQAKSPDQVNGGQFRRTVREFKMYTRSRKDWRLPSGLAISKLSDERYAKVDARDDEALANLLKATLQRLEYDLTVKHPVLNEMITTGNADQKMVDLRTNLRKAVDALKVLSEPNCTRLQALQVWEDVFNHSYWRGLIDKERDRLKEEKEKEERQRSAAAAGILQRGKSSPSQQVLKGGGNGFG